MHCGIWDWCVVRFMRWVYLVVSNYVHILCNEFCCLTSVCTALLQTSRLYNFIFIEYITLQSRAVSLAMPPILQVGAAKYHVLADISYWTVVTSHDCSDVQGPHHILYNHVRSHTDDSIISYPYNISAGAISYGRLTNSSYDISYWWLTNSSIWHSCCCYLWGMSMSSSVWHSNDHCMSC